VLKVIGQPQRHAKGVLEQAIETSQQSLERT